MSNQVFKKPVLFQRIDFIPIDPQQVTLYDALSLMLRDLGPNQVSTYTTKNEAPDPFFELRQSHVLRFDDAAKGWHNRVSLPPPDCVKVFTRATDLLWLVCQITPEPRHIYSLFPLLESFSACMTSVPASPYCDGSASWVSSHHANYDRNNLSLLPISSIVAARFIL